MFSLPDHPDIVERYYHIRNANNCVRVVIRDKSPAPRPQYSRNLVNLRLEVRRDTGPESMEWVTVPGTVTLLLEQNEAMAKAADLYHGGWRPIIQKLFDQQARSNQWSSFLKAPSNAPTWRCLSCDKETKVLVGTMPPSCCEEPVWAPHGTPDSRRSEPSETIQADSMGDAEDQVLAMYTRFGGEPMVRLISQGERQIPVIAWIPPDEMKPIYSREHRMRAVQGSSKILELAKEFGRASGTKSLTPVVS